MVLPGVVKSPRGESSWRKQAFQGTGIPTSLCFLLPGCCRRAVSSPFPPCCGMLSQPKAGTKWSWTETMNQNKSFLLKLIISGIFFFTATESWQGSWTLIIKIDPYFQNYPEDFISLSSVTFWSLTSLQRVEVYEIMVSDWFVGCLNKF